MESVGGMPFLPSQIGSHMDSPHIWSNRFTCINGCRHRRHVNHESDPIYTVSDRDFACAVRSPVHLYA